MNTCSSCHQPVRWITLAPSGRRHPLNPVPSDTGTIVLDAEDRGRVVPKHERLGLIAQGKALYVSHFATCPHAAAHRKQQTA